MAGLATIGVKLSYKATTSASTYTDFPNLMSAPEIGGDPEKIDVTVLSDSARKYIAGVKDYGDLEFGFLYDANQTSSAWTMFKAIEGKVTDFQLTLPDTSKFAFKAIPTLKLSEMGVNEALKFTVSMAMQSDVTYTPKA